MFGICVAVKATTSYSSRPRYTRLKLWKSRPAAPAISTRVLFMHKAYARTQDGARVPAPLPTRALTASQRLAHALGDRFHLDLGARDLAQELVRRRALPLRPEIAKERAGLAGGEPGRPEALSEVVPQLCLERPRAQVRVDVEAGVDVGEVVRRARLDLRRVAEQLDVPLRHRVGLAVGEELELVEQLRRVPADEEEQPHHSLGRVLVGPWEVEAPREPGRLVGQVLQEHRPPFGHGGVAEPLLLHGEVARGVAVVLRVPGLVEERAPVVGSADRLDHEHHLVGDLDRGAERARRLLRALLDIEVDVLLTVEV